MATPPDKKKLKGFKEFDPSKYIDVEPTIEEAVMKNAVVVSFGRMNPITSGHEKLIDKVTSEAARRKADPMVFMSHSQDAKKNPLSYDDKVKFAKKAFGNTIQKSNSKTIIDIAKSLSGKYKNFVMVVGSDRVDEFQKMLTKYNGKEFNFENIEIVSAGERDPDAEGVEGMSASKMRSLASDNNVKEFSKGLPKKLQSSAPTIMAAVRKGMNMTEETTNENIDEALNQQQRRKRSIAMRKNRFKVRRGKQKSERKTATRDVLLKRARKAAFSILKKKFAKNRPYAELSAGEKQVIDKRIEKVSPKRIEAIARKLVPVVKQRERDRRASKAAAASGASKNESVNEASLKDTRTLKRPHQLMDSNNKPKFDARFRMFKKKNVNESVEDFTEELVDLIESTEKFVEAKLPHALDPNKSLKHAYKDRGVDRDNDGDVDKFDKQDIPDEITGAEKINQTAKMLKKNAGELKHTRKGMAYEEVEPILEYESDLAKMKKVDSYKVGDKIYTKVGGRWHKGHVTTPLNKAGNHGVKFQHGGKTHSYVSSPDELRLHVEEVELDEISMSALNNYTAAANKDYDKAHAAGDHKKTFKRALGLMKASGKKIEKDTNNIRNALRKEEIDEAVDKSSDVYKQYLELKKKSVKELRDMIKRSSKVVDVSGYDKHGAISDILRSRHGNKKVAAAMGLDEATFKVDIQGLPAMFIDAESAPQVKKTLRQMLKKPDDTIKAVDRVQPAEVKKHFRLKALGKEEESDPVKEAYYYAGVAYRKKPDFLKDKEKKEKENKPVKEEAGAGEEGTDKLVKKYKKDTPNCS